MLLFTPFTVTNAHKTQEQRFGAHCQSCQNDSLGFSCKIRMKTPHGSDK